MAGYFPGYTHRDNSKILSRGYIGQYPPSGEGVYWSKPQSRGFYYCLEGVYWSIPPLGRRGYITQYPHCEKGGNLFFSNYNGNGIGMARRYWKNILLILRG